MITIPRLLVVWILMTITFSQCASAEANQTTLSTETSNQTVTSAPKGTNATADNGTLPTMTEAITNHTRVKSTATFSTTTTQITNHTRVKSTATFSTTATQRSIHDNQSNEEDGNSKVVVAWVICSLIAIVCLGMYTYHKWKQGTKVTRYLGLSAF